MPLTKQALCLTLLVKKLKDFFINKPQQFLDNLKLNNP